MFEFFKSKQLWDLLNPVSDLQEIIDYGGDFITTDEPAVAKQLIEKDWNRIYSYSMVNFNYIKK